MSRQHTAVHVHVGSKCDAPSPPPTSLHRTSVMDGFGTHVAALLLGVIGLVAVAAVLAAVLSVALIAAAVALATAVFVIVPPAVAATISRERTRRARTAAEIVTSRATELPPVPAPLAITREALSSEVA